MEKYLYVFKILFIENLILRCKLIPSYNSFLSKR